MMFVNTVEPNTANSAMTAIGSRTNPDYCSTVVEASANAKLKKRQLFFGIRPESPI
ncbi:hypothetical protein BGY98DRAFT_1019557 [Russula aff. rugulosa BPL654]|nr:hypothetical protein BGY98DRAFT_1019557 [Russula aff. rugulosa BPL654]